MVMRYTEGIKLLVYKKLFKKIDSQLAKANSLRGALFRLQAVLNDRACAHIAYTFLLHRNSYIRGDEVSGTTMPDSVTKYYWKNGGTNTDPVVELIPKITEPVLMDLQEYFTNKDTIYYNNPYLGGIIENQWHEMMIYPVMPDDGTGGYCALTFLGVPEAQPYSEQFYLDLGHHFHSAIRKHGFLKQYFKITEKEKAVLEGMAVGKTTADIASELGLKQRAIELRLQNARKKLRARTTTEAVYKAAAYSIIFGGKNTD